MGAEEEVTEADLIEALLSVMTPTDENPEGVYTTEDLRKRTGRGINLIRRKLGELQELGRLERVILRRKNLAGVQQPRTAYRIKR